MRNKEYALGIDSMCHQLNNYSKASAVLDIVRSSVCIRYSFCEAHLSGFQAVAAVLWCNIFTSG